MDTTTTIKIVAAAVCVGSAVGSLITFLAVRQKMHIVSEKWPKVIYNLADYVKGDVKYLILFLLNSVMSICWYTICLGAAKLTCWISSLFAFQGYTTPIVLKGLELFFLIFGVVVAVLYFTIQTYQLVNDILKNQFHKRDVK